MNRAPKQQDRFWTVREIAADPEGACAYIRELRDSRNSWHRKFDKAEKEARLLRRRTAGHEPPALAAVAKGLA